MSLGLKYAKHPLDCMWHNENSRDFGTLGRVTTEEFAARLPPTIMPILHPNRQPLGMSWMFTQVNGPQSMMPPPFEKWLYASFEPEDWDLLMFPPRNCKITQDAIKAYETPDNPLGYGYILFKDAESLTLYKLKWSEELSAYRR